MEIEKVKLGEIEEKKNTPESLKSCYSSSTLSSNFTFEADALPTNLFELQKQLFINKIHEMLRKYNDSFICLRDTFTEVNLLQEENLKLRDESIHLSILITAVENEILASFLVPGGNNVPDFQNLAIVTQNPGAVPRSNIPNAIPVRANGLPEMNKAFASLPVPGGEDVTDLLSNPAGRNQDPCEKMTSKKKTDLIPRGSVPNAISIRANGFSKSNNRSGDSSSLWEASSTGSNPPHCLRVKDTSSQGDEDGEIELHVYKQGTTKTELCNKWEETGNCPYGDRCQFAHGVQELRPVLRHPRYKTQICRMISSGGSCPYGHRCHFRHALDPNQEKEVVL